MEGKITFERVFKLDERNIKDVATLRIIIGVLKVRIETLDEEIEDVRLQALADEQGREM